MLYKSYRARGYLLFLGQQAKQGTLPEQHLPLMGWPEKKDQRPVAGCLGQSLDRASR
ncbi:MAG: hypothetical protein M0C28_30890 [Candidatus Moduliflexus flocculans]|nr:hypothetical protein [Candidatus Moduliflexus flocculans]